MTWLITWFIHQKAFIPGGFDEEGHEYHKDFEAHGQFELLLKKNYEVSFFNINTKVYYTIMVRTLYHLVKS